MPSVHEVLAAFTSPLPRQERSIVSELWSNSYLCPAVSGALGLRGATVPPVGTVPTATHHR